jgi:hypothetical protein
MPPTARCVVTDEKELAGATFDVRGFAKKAALAGRLADVGSRLAAWRDGDTDPGGPVADALDQLERVLGDLERD